MAARSRCHERFFRIDRSRNRMWKRYTRRSRGRQYFNASVEAPDMTAAIFVVTEGNALPFPFNRRGIFVRHIQSPLSGLSDLPLRAASAAEYLSSARPAIPQAHHRVLANSSLFSSEPGRLQMRADARSKHISQMRAVAVRDIANQLSLSRIAPTTSFVRRHNLFSALSHRSARRLLRSSK